MCHPEVVMSSLSSRGSFSWSMARDRSMSSINFVLERHLHLKVSAFVFSFSNHQLCSLHEYLEIVIISLCLFLQRN